jgi:hypothetical protein
MHACARLSGLVVLAVLAQSPAALGQTTAQTASKWGLVGTWRLDCSKPMDGNNPDLAYVVRDGKLFHDRNFGDKRDSSAVVLATTKADGTIEIVVEFASLSQTRQFSFMKAEGGRIRAMSNRNVNTNEYSVRDGKFTANGNATPWQTRCR